MISLSTLITESLLAGIFKSIGGVIADSSIKLAKGKGNKILESLNDTQIANDYLNNAVHKIFVFRTITKGDRDVYLDEIYHPLKISKGGRKKGRKLSIGNNAKIKSDGCSVIVGLAGQGKTTIMRKLFLEEVVRKERLPFFITLRQYDYTNKGCEDIILDHLTSNGIECVKNDVVDILKTKKVILFFDGFDEIISAQRNNALNMISSIFDKYGCSSIVTTRPDTEITRQPGVSTYAVEYLTPGDVQEMVIKIVNNQDVSGSILSTLQQKKFLRQTIKTPILVDVLIVTSSSLGDNPNSIGDYYNHLFSALMFRHDLNKNYNREKKSNLSNRVLEECFSFFSFFSLMESNGDFTLDSMLALFKRASEAKKINISEEFICSDVVDGTNLIVRDGYDKYVYIHRSIQEYFSAKCIAQFSVEQKKVFLGKYSCLENKKKNSNMLVMLSHIDPVCFYKSYLTPLLERNGVLYEGKIIHLNKSDVERYIDNWQVGIDDDDIDGVSAFSQYNNSQDMASCYFRDFIHVARLRGLEIDDEDPSMYLMTDCDGSIIEFIKENKPGKNIRNEINNIFGDDLHWISVSQIKGFIEGYDKFVVTPFYESYLKTVKVMQKIIDEEYIKKIESESVVTGILSDMGY